MTEFHTRACQRLVASAWALVLLGVAGCAHDTFSDWRPGPTRGNIRFKLLEDAELVQEGWPTYIALVPCSRLGEQDVSRGFVSRGTVVKIEGCKLDNINEWGWGVMTVKTFARIMNGPHKGLLVESSEAAGMSLDPEFLDDRVVELDDGDRLNP